MGEEIDIIQEQVEKKEAKRQEELIMMLNRMIESGDVTSAIQLMMRNREYFSFEMIEQVKRNANNPEKVREILNV